MGTLHLIRGPSTDQDIRGVLMGVARAAHTIELPRRRNLRNRSCISPGIHIVRPGHSR